MLKKIKDYIFFCQLGIIFLSASNVFAADKIMPELSTADSKPAVLRTQFESPEKRVLVLEQETDKFMRELIEQSDLSDTQIVHSSDVMEKQSITAVTSEPLQLKVPAKFDVNVSEDKKIAKLYPEHLRGKTDIVYAQAIRDNKITLNEAIAIGLENNINLLSSRKKVEVAKARLSEARRALLPTLQLQFKLNGGKAGGSSTNLGGRIYKGDHRKFNFTQVLYDGGELWFTIKQAEAGLKSAETEFKKSKAEFAQSVASAYYGLVKAEYNLQYQEGVFKEVEILHGISVESRVKGVISEIDALNMESQYRSAYLQWHSSRNDLTATKLAFYFTLRLDPERPLPLDLKLTMDKPALTLPSLMQMAYEKNADIVIKKLALESAEWGLKVFAAKKKPKIDLRGSAGLVGEVFKDDIAIAADNHDLDQEKEWFIGVAGKIPIGLNTLSYEQTKHRYGPTALSLTGSEDWEHKFTFDVLDRLADYTDERSAESTLYQSQAELDKAKFDVESQLRENFYNFQKALIQTDSAMLKIVYQQKQNEITKYMMGMGESSASSYIDGLISQAENKYALIQSAADYNLSYLNLKIISGDVDNLGF